MYSHCNYDMILPNLHISVHKTSGKHETAGALPHSFTLCLNCERQLDLIVKVCLPHKCVVVANVDLF